MSLDRFLPEDCREYLLACARRLTPLLEPYGFSFEEADAGVSSGGPFANGFFVHPRLKIGLIIRSRAGLGCVVYESGEANAAHGDVLAELGVDAPALLYEQDQFESYSRAGDDPIDALASDLSSALLPQFESSPARVEAAIQTVHQRWLQSLGIRQQ